MMKDIFGFFFFVKTNINSQIMDLWIQSGWLLAGVSLFRRMLKRGLSPAVLAVINYHTHLPHSGAIIVPIKWLNAPC